LWSRLTSIHSDTSVTVLRQLPLWLALIALSPMIELKSLALLFLFTAYENYSTVQIQLERSQARESVN
jgi:hypothetical protein